MAELLIFRHNQIADDFYNNLKRYKSGDVIVVCENGWPWGVQELNSPMFRIVSIPSMTVSEASQFVAPEVDTDPNNPSKTLKRRAFKLDFDNITLPQAIKAWWQDDTRATPIVKPSDFGITKAQVVALKVDKGVTQDPAIIGDVGAVIG